MTSVATELLQLATDLATDAGGMLLELFQAPARGVHSKTTPTDLVSEADQEAERLILAGIAAARPDDGVLAEEGGREATTTGYRWIVDPLDGTVNFLYRIPQWCVSIAVEDEAGTLIGVVHDPTRGETFTAARGEGAGVNGVAISVSDVSDLPMAMIGTGFAYDARARAVQADRIQRMLPLVRDIRRPGSAAIDLCWLACGRYDGFFEAPMNEWDKAAGSLIATEAGAVVSELLAPLDDAHGVIAANEALHDKLRSLVLGEE